MPESQTKPSAGPRKICRSTNGLLKSLLALSASFVLSTCSDSTTEPDVVATTELAGTFAAATAPTFGALVVDPTDPTRLRFADGSSFYMCGAGDPEDFLYRGARLADGTRSGDQDPIIDKIAPTGANGIYFQIVRSHGGDGAPDHNPFVDSDPAKGLDPDILAQWDLWFTRLEQAGVLIHLFFYDDGSKIWDTNESIGPEEAAFVRAIVDRFEHHPFLVWVLAEEYGEAYSAQRMSALASVIRAADDHRHIIAVHKNVDTTLEELADDPNIDQFAMQTLGHGDQVHASVVEAWRNARGRYVLNMAETDQHGTGAQARRTNWASAMGGATVMVLGMDIASTSLSDLRDCGRQVEFLQRVSLAGMRPRDDLALADARWVLADPGHRYVAYTPGSATRMGVGELAEGSYDLTWLDTESGAEAAQTAVEHSGGDATWSVPAGFSDEIALWVRPAGSGGSGGGSGGEEPGGGEGGGGTEGTNPYGSGLVARYAFDGPEGESPNVTRDASGSGRDATCSEPECPTYVAEGRHGGALDFDGRDDELEVAGTFAPPAQGSVAFWFQTDATGERTRFLGSDDAFEVTLEAGGVLGNQLFAGGSEYVAAGGVRLGTWHHAVFTYDHASGSQQIWLDGRLAASGSQANDQPPEHELSIGTRNGTGEHFNGRLDELAIWNRVLNASEVAALYGSTPPGTDTEPPAPEDTTPPSVELTAPTTASTLAGNVTLSASASDVGGVASVSFRVDGVPLGSDASAPYELTWNTTTVSDGSHTLTAVASDNAGNSATSNVVTVQVSNGGGSGGGSGDGGTGGTLGAGLLALYHFDHGVDESAELVRDFSGNGRHASCSGESCPSFVVSGRVGGAVDFDGVDDALRAGVLTPPTQGSVAFWFRSDVNTRRQRFFGSDDAFEATLESGGIVGNQLFAGGSEFLQAGPVEPGVWYHVVLTYDRASGRQELWLDGRLAASGNTADDDPAAAELRLGNRTGAADFLNGRLDELAIWNRVLSAVEVATIYGGATPQSDGSLPPEPQQPEQDVTTPQVGVLAPANGATVSGMVTLSADALDDRGVSEVAFLIDGSQVGSDPTAPYQLSWNSASVENGVHALTVVATDGAGNATTSAPSAFNVANSVGVVFPGASWEVRSPAEVGMDAAKLDEIAARIGGDGVVVKDGYVVKSWGATDVSGDWASAGKPVISTMLFFAVHEGRLPGVDAPVRPFVQSIFGRDLIEKDQAMTFAQLANMTSGYALPEEAGTAWGYNDYGVNLLARLLFRGVFQTGAEEAARHEARLGKLQFQDGSLFGSRAGFGVTASVRDFARIGWFWLNRGSWRGEQLLPQRYFDELVRPHVPASLPRTAGGVDDYLDVGSYGGDTDQYPFGPGIYGLHWWFNVGGAAWPDAPHDLIHANGHGNGELMFVLPTQRIVIAARGNWGSWEPGTASDVNQILKLLTDAVR